MSSIQDFKLLMFCKSLNGKCQIKTSVPKISVFVQIYAMCILFPLLSSCVLAHSGHTDPILSELNDYLVAIQLLKEDNPRAKELYLLWLTVRNESWHTRELVDKQNLAFLFMTFRSGQNDSNNSDDCWLCCNLLSGRNRFSLLQK